MYDGATGFAYLDNLRGNPRAYYVPSQLEEMIEDAEWSLDQALYFTPLVYTDGRVTREDGKIVTGRQKGSAKEGCVLFSDADDAQPEDFKLAPSIAIESSPNRWHCYWLLDQGHSALEIAAMNKKIAYAHHDKGADLSGAHLTKLLLVPGSPNTKIDRATGQLVHPDKPIAKGYNTGEVYSMADFIEAYGEVVTNSDISVDVGERPEGTLDFMETYAKLPEVSATGSNFNELVFTEVWKDGGDRRIGDRSAARWKLLCDLFREDLTPQEVMTIGWGAKSASKWHDDPRGLDGLWEEVARARVTVELERGIGVGEDETPEDYQESRAGVPLLTEEERALVRNDVTFIQLFEGWAKDRLQLANLPYHRLNAWSTLALAFGERCVIADESRDVPLNFFSLSIGETATGKGDAKAMFHEMVEACVPGGFNGSEGVNIGANASINALTEVLIERDGLVSLLQSDEAHGVFNMMKQAKWTTGTIENWTDLYDGEVGKIQRTGNRDVSNKSAKTVFNIWLQGTMEGLRKALDRDMFDSGFLGRFIWYIGDPPIETKESMIPRDRDDEQIARGYDPFVRQMGDEFNEIRANFRKLRGFSKGPIRAEREALHRLGEANWVMKQFASQHRYSHALLKAQRRMGMNIRKAATLLAIHEQSEMVTERHMLHAISAAEEWFENLVIMAGEISGSDSAREAEEIFRFIEGAGGFVSIAKLNRAFKDRTVAARQQQIQDLILQGRIQEGREGRTKGYKVVE